MRSSSQSIHGSKVRMFLKFKRLEILRVDIKIIEFSVAFSWDLSNNLVLLLLLLLVLLNKGDLLKSVLVALQLVDVEALDDEEDEHDGADAELVLGLLVHHVLGLLVSNSHENGLEGVALLL